LRQAVKVPLTGLKVAPYYGCTLVRPRDVSVEPAGGPQVFTEFMEALGATVVPFPAATLCCGSYQILANPEAALTVAGTIVERAGEAGADALVLSCPLCEFNLGKKQGEIRSQGKASKPVPTFYFTQLLAVALGVSSDACRFELNEAASLALLKAKNFPV
jgi:heterodisulfide reductase subunit B